MGVRPVEPDQLFPGFNNNFCVYLGVIQVIKCLSYSIETSSAGDELIDDKFTFTDTPQSVRKFMLGIPQHKLNIYFFSNSS